MKIPFLCLAAPPLAASRYTCGTSCAAPVTVLWLAGWVAIIAGLLGGPLGREDISWTTLIIGMILWAVSSFWTFMATKNLNSCRSDKDST